MQITTALPLQMAPSLPTVALESSGLDFDQLVKALSLAQSSPAAADLTTVDVPEATISDAPSEPETPADHAAEHHQTPEIDWQDITPMATLIPAGLVTETAIPITDYPAQLFEFMLEQAKVQTSVAQGAQDHWRAAPLRDPPPQTAQVTDSLGLGSLPPAPKTGGLAVGKAPNSMAVIAPEPKEHSHTGPADPSKANADETGLAGLGSGPTVSLAQKYVGGGDAPHQRSPVSNSGSASAPGSPLTPPIGEATAKTTAASATPSALPNTTSVVEETGALYEPDALAHANQIDGDIQAAFVRVPDNRAHASNHTIAPVVNAGPRPTARGAEEAHIRWPDKDPFLPAQTLKKPPTLSPGEARAATVINAFAPIPTPAFGAFGPDAALTGAPPDAPVPITALSQALVLTDGRSLSPSQQIAQSIIRLGADGYTGPVELTLKPSELGQVRFEMTATGDKVHVTIFIERPDSMDLIRRHGDQLLADLRHSGFSQPSLSFGDWSQRESRMAKPSSPDRATAPTAAQTDDAVITAQTHRTAATGRLDLRL